MSVPEGVSVVGRQDRPDLTIYDFSRDNQVFMGLYIGLAPSFHPAKDEDGVETETVGGLPAETRVVKSPDGWSRDIVIELAGHRFCHFFYRDLQEPDLLLADHIIGSPCATGPDRRGSSPSPPGPENSARRRASSLRLLGPTLPLLRATGQASDRSASVLASP